MITVKKKRKLVIVGDSAFAEIAHEYFSFDTEYEVVAFSVEKKYLKCEEFHGLPVIPFEDIKEKYPPQTHEVFVAVVYGQLNRLRARLVSQAKKMGYKLASYVSPNAFVWRNVEIGEHCFIFENNTLQPFVRIGNNVVLWSGNHIGHHSTIGDHCFISSQVVISGYCEIGDYSFLGVNSSVANNVVIGSDNWLGPSTLVTRNTESGSLFKADDTIPAKVTAPRFFKVPKNEMD